MERGDFTCIEPTWWLNGPGLEFASSELRKDIGDHLGWGRETPWYLEPARLDDLFNTLELRRAELLTNVDLAKDELARQTWLQEVADLVNPASVSNANRTGDAPANEPTGTSTERTAAQTTAPAKPSAFGSNKPADSPAQAAADTPLSKPSPFGARKKAEPDAAPVVANVEITEELQPVVADLAEIVANVVAAVPGAEELSPEELSQLVSEVLAEA
jgi:hypothetical protein